MGLVKMSLQGFFNGKFEKPAAALYYVFLNSESFSRTSTNAYDSSQPTGVGGSAQYYLQVAPRNHLVHLGRLVPGTVLHFPSLVLSTSTLGPLGLAGYAPSPYPALDRPGHARSHGQWPAAAGHPGDYDYQGYQSP